MSALDKPRTYRIRSAAGHFSAGRLPDGRQILVGVQLPQVIVLYFSPHGEFMAISLVDIPTSASQPTLEDAGLFLTYWKASAGFQPDTIQVRPFLIRDRYIGIADLPEHYQDVIDHPEHFDESRRKELLQDIHRWQRRGDFVFFWDEDYYLDREGGLMSS